MRLECRADDQSRHAAMTQSQARTNEIYDVCVGEVLYSVRYEQQHGGISSDDTPAISCVLRVARGHPERRPREDCSYYQDTRFGVSQSFASIGSKTRDS